ncbi:helicase [Candidatus Kuenenbacteria bacterium HGW-Kuenenbacteria-1]|uniref:Helicase n=1 Tax=Candidatus Kuenenbacteria bacterium HGW-Kuenenbacteria-1 TaxID=2013812 RepID=A0A2N1UNI6_9BACT|nr:MAG: helicase [Candidatus Kuenenbacteria bacterium HGW-Kuenenbacteria-1]
MTQEEAFDILKLGHNVFLTGPAGSGKTFLLNKYINYLKKNHKAVAITASTGIAATHMGGITIHSWSGMGIKENLTTKDLQMLLKKPYLKKRFKNVGVLIIDEISMLHSYQFDLIHHICQAFKNNPEPFAGIQIICSGDFFQLPPIQKKEKPKFVFDSEIWENMDIKICYLEEQHRQGKGDLLTLLNHIRKNEIYESKKILANRNNKEKFFSTAITKLYTHNIDVDAINTFELAKINEKEIIYYMEARGNKDVIDALKKGCLAPEKLILKKGAKVMFVKNNFDKGYVNGTLGHVIKFDADGLPVIQIANGEHIMVENTKWTIEENEFIIAEINQLPIRLAWAITIHKSQGMNLDSAEIDLSKSFIKGMGYVALSRLHSLAGLKLIGINELALMVDSKILEKDKILEQRSQELVKDLREMKIWEKEKKQKQFLNSLTSVEQNKIYFSQKKDKESTFEKTKKLVYQKFLIKEIAKHRGLTEDTIISHLEKMVSQKEKINLEYLRPPKERFEKIKIAFQQTDDFKLSLVKEILGNDFSYSEIKLVRLFLFF